MTRGGVSGGNVGETTDCGAPIFDDGVPFHVFAQSCRDVVSYV